MKKIMVNIFIATLAFCSHNLIAQEDVIAQGEEVYMARCDYCHGEGPQKGGAMFLGQRYQGSKPAILHDRTDLVPEFIRVIVRSNTPGMTPIRITEVNEQELDALIAYLTRNNPQ